MPYQMAWLTDVVVGNEKLSNATKPLPVLVWDVHEKPTFVPLPFQTGGWTRTGDQAAGVAKSTRTPTTHATRTSVFMNPPRINERNESMRETSSNMQVRHRGSRPSEP